MSELSCFVLKNGEIQAIFDALLFFMIFTVEYPAARSITPISISISLNDVRGDSV
jgi:hypothetical protein